MFNTSVANSNTKDCITCTYIVCVCWTEIMRDQNVNELWCKIFVWCHFQLCMSKISSFKELCKTSQFIYEFFIFFLQTLFKLKIRDIHILEYNSNCPWFNAVFLLSCNIWFQKICQFLIHSLWIILTSQDFSWRWYLPRSLLHQCEYEINLLSR